MEFAQTPSGGFLYKQLQEKKKKKREKTNQLKINKYNKNSHKERGRDETVIMLVMIFMKDVDFAFGSWVPLLL